MDSKIYVYEVKELLQGEINKTLLGYLTLPPMAEEVFSFKDEDGIVNLAIGNESFSKRYEIDRARISPKGMMVFDFEKLLKIKKNERFVGNPHFVNYVDVDMPRKKHDENEERIIDDDER